MQVTNADKRVTRRFGWDDESGLMAMHQYATGSVVIIVGNVLMPLPLKTMNLSGEWLSTGLKTVNAV